MLNIDVKEAESPRMKCQDCPLWNDDRMYCQHPLHEFPDNDWRPDNEPFDTCPLKEQPIKIQLINQ